MPQAPTREFIRALAAANGLTIPDERLDTVLMQYGNFMATLGKIDSLDISAELEPAIVYSLMSPPEGPDTGRGK